ncbi:SDR family oxidoreductase [Arthrobacter sp. NPDC058130]|uniref:SDR family oxidoreductase n=1 Tax=Arthrobacter sp. NPDC058130 TaxID=3346353 RepID=UPI0036EC1F64
MSEQEPVLVVGATGSLGGQVVDRLLARGKKVRALVRPTSNAGRLEAKGVEIARGDMLDLESLIAAMTGAAAVITTAAGYTGNNKNAHEIDTLGNTNLAVAASKVGVKRFVLTSILTSDQTPDVPHFWHKKLAEDKLEELGVPFVALRPGAFFDQIAQLGGDPFEKGRIIWLGSKNVPLTFVLTSDLATYLAEAVDANVADGERIDLGWTRPTSMRESADVASRLRNKKIRVLAMPTGLLRAVGKIVGKSAPLMSDMGGMAAWFDSGRYVANTTRQTELFGPAPTPEDAITRFAAGLGH